jgi:hypothetical protein
MSRYDAADAADVIAALHEERAWFRHGVSDDRIVEITGLPIERVMAGRRWAEAHGLLVRVSLLGETVGMLTPLGVARARGERGSVAPGGAARTAGSP